MSERGNLRTSDEANMDAREFVPQVDSPGRVESRESRSWVIVIVLPSFHSVPCVDPQWAKGLLESLVPDRSAIRVIVSSCNEDFVRTGSTHSGREREESISNELEHWRI